MGLEFWALCDSVGLPPIGGYAASAALFVSSQNLKIKNKYIYKQIHLFLQLIYSRGRENKGKSLKGGRGR